MTILFRIVMVILIGAICLTYTVNTPASKKYWKDVGPAWDKALNPIKYNNLGE